MATDPSPAPKFGLGSIIPFSCSPRRGFLPQPLPMVTMVTTTPSGDYTSITRVFPQGSTAHCNFCHGRCYAVADVCQLMVRGRVDAESGSSYEARGVWANVGG